MAVGFAALAIPAVYAGLTLGFRSGFGLAVTCGLCCRSLAPVAAPATQIMRLTVATQRSKALIVFNEVDTVRSWSYSLKSERGAVAKRSLMGIDFEDRRRYPPARQYGNRFFSCLHRINVGYWSNSRVS
jgi:hypothetical protein